MVDPKCDMCIEELIPGRYPVSELPVVIGLSRCGHEFHLDCLTKYIQNDFVKKRKLLRWCWMIMHRKNEEYWFILLQITPRIYISSTRYFMVQKKAMDHVFRKKNKRNVGRRKKIHKCCSQISWNQNKLMAGQEEKILWPGLVK